MTHFDRTALSLGILGLISAAALTACHSEDASNDATPPSSSPKAASVATPAADAPAATAATPGTAGVEWKDMNREEREHYMKSVVLPHMRPRFAEWDPGEFGDIKCGTCHGASAKDKTFKMPNPRLPRLPADAAGWKALEAKEPEALKFMREVVVPQMAEMLGEPKYDPATQQGFGCFKCHTARQ